jgi:bifunctional DNA-binding transcriptional regulator/antitoxin component of YhaV-PrlF toxin-antitoxin module
MIELTLAKVTRKGQMTIPQPLREALDIQPGQAAEERGIREDEDLDAIVEEAQRRAYQERYGE